MRPRIKNRGAKKWKSVLWGMWSVEMTPIGDFLFMKRVWIILGMWWMLVAQKYIWNSDSTNPNELNNWIKYGYLNMRTLWKKSSNQLQLMSVKFVLIDELNEMLPDFIDPLMNIFKYVDLSSCKTVQLYSREWYH